VGAFDLLILDFEGVCTPTVSQRIADPDLPLEHAAAQRVVERARSAGLTVVILSNEIDPGWIATHPVLADADHIVNCADNRIFKPDRRAFQRCLLLSGATAERTLVVDDDPDNVTVAASLGMTALRFDPDDVSGSWAAVDLELSR
jgi:FMN phosphatase YigB (HAD superfamily)